MDLKFIKMFKDDGDNSYNTIEFINDKDVIYQIPVEKSVEIDEKRLEGKIVRIDNIFTPIKKELNIVK